MRLDPPATSRSLDVSAADGETPIRVSRTFLSVAVVVAAVIIGVVVWWRIGTDSGPNYLAGSYTGGETGYTQRYQINKTMFVSSPVFLSSSTVPIFVHAVVPEVVGSCHIKILSELAFSDSTPVSGYFVTGPYDASYELKRIARMKVFGNIRSVAIDKQAASAWYDTITFRVPQNCVVHIKGFDVTYVRGRSTYREFLSEASTFFPQKQPI